MPTPRYRNERERNYTEDNKRRIESDTSDSERSGQGGTVPSSGVAALANKKRGAKGLRESVGGGV